ncbi:hypothetical protein QBC47DRAFT_164647 [Echria macrotheca]|uniref:Uncharacterized protein n=1 Tax=Echria macrotheca TaxID=438768 RepID=A0AAJ0BGZ0_9PEZI|nr:hypothetical protein QBC47DRAFT_164647 [Echria macrotheca]
MKTTQVLTSSVLYTLLLFTAGFICGLIRVPLLEPLIGDRYAQLLELPLMMAIARRAAAGVVSRTRTRTRTKTRSPPTKKSNGEKGDNMTRGGYWAIGILAVVWLLLIEMGMYEVLNKEGKKGWREWVWERDLVAGSAFLGALVYCAVLPAALA